MKTVILFIGLCICAFPHQSRSQINPVIAGMTLSEVVSLAELMHLDTASALNQRRYKHYMRWKTSVEPYVDEKGQLGNFATRNVRSYYRLRDEIQQVQNISQRATHGDWASISPGQAATTAPFNGRVNVIAVHPANDDIVYIGTALGGLWRSYNAGATWTCLTDGLPIIGVSGIVISENSDTLFILTGDGESSHCPSVGVLLSPDGGNTWQPTGFKFDEADYVVGHALIQHPNAPEIMYAATRNGLYRTSNYWKTSQFVVSDNIFDIEFKPDDPNIIYACGKHHIWRSVNNGLGTTWSAISLGDSVLPQDSTTRIALSVSPADPNRVLALYGRDDAPAGTFSGLFVSDDIGDHWDLVCDTPNIVGNQTWYDLEIAEDPNHDGRVFVGGVHVYFNDDVFSNPQWIKSGINQIHADIHCIKFTPTYVYLATDGGMLRSEDGGINWINISVGLNIGQIYDFDVKGNEIIAGLQDNGTLKWQIGDVTSANILGGDGFECMFHPTNPNILYACTQVNRNKSYDQGESWITITPFEEYDAWDATWIMHPTRPDTQYAAKYTIWRTYNGGSTWDSTLAFFYTNETIRAIAQSRSDPNRVYASERTRLKRTYNIHEQSPAWTSIDDGLTCESCKFGGIAVDPTNPNRLWVTYLGYLSDKKVYYSGDAGEHWTNFSGTLPNIPVFCIAYQPGSNDGLYIGTAIGVFYRNAGMTDWIYFSNGLPAVRIEDLKISDGYLYAATYGRGAWRTELYSPCPLSFNLTPSNDPSNPYSTGIQEYSALESIFSTRHIVGGIGTDVTYRAGAYLQMNTGFEVKSWCTFEAKLDGCPD